MISLPSAKMWQKKLNENIKRTPIKHSDRKSRWLQLLKRNKNLPCNCWSIQVKALFIIQKLQSSALITGVLKEWNSVPEKLINNIPTLRSPVGRADGFSYKKKQITYILRTEVNWLYNAQFLTWNLENFWWKMSNVP
jgi:hypothetical protein